MLGIMVSIRFVALGFHEAHAKASNREKQEQQVAR